MLLYHGTSGNSSTIESIMKNGIKPRIDEGRSNWEISSREDCVYLTDCYAGYFACAASKDKEPWAIIEVDTDKLDQNLFLPDEDFVSQYFKLKGPDWAQNMTLIELTEYMRDNLEQYANCWHESIEGLGNCCYRGIIPASAITRIAIFEPTSNGDMAIMAMDPTITLINHQIMGKKYKMLTQWLMGEEVTVETYKTNTHFFYDWIGAPSDEQLAEMLEKRDIKVIFPSLDSRRVYNGENAVV